MKQLITLCIIIIQSSAAWAVTPLPYSRRTRPYNGFTSGPVGDIRTVGMAGATAGLGDTFLAASSNPAGLAMTLGGGDTNLSQNEIHDGNLQEYSERIGLGSIGAAANAYPWGFSMGRVPIGQEGQNYILPSGSPAPFNNQASHISIATHEYRFAVARIFWKNRLALGGSLNIGLGEEEIGSPRNMGTLPLSAYSDDHHKTGVSGTLGAMAQFSRRLLLGVAYTFPMHYAFEAEPTPALPGFLQPMDVPSRFDVALGWIPNRLIRGSAGLTVIGKTPGAALLRDDSSLVGDSAVYQPKLGLAYVFLEFGTFKGTLFTGTYFEHSRIEGVSSRMHVTGGIEVKAWIVTTGLGVDASSNYKNSLFSLGLDLGRILQGLNLMPTPTPPRQAGLFHNPIYLSDEGLARPLVENWQPGGPDMNPLTIIKDLPENVKKEMNVIRDQFYDFAKPTEPRALPKPSPGASPKSSPKSSKEKSRLSKKKAKKTSRSNELPVVEDDVR